MNGVVTERWMYDRQLRPIAELESDGRLRSQFIYGDRENVPEYVVKEDDVYRIITDHLSSPLFVVDVATGEVAQQIRYDDFGKVSLDTNPGFQPFGFGGGLYDHHTGLVHFGFRELDPEVGRWITKDPLGFAGGGANVYTYVRNDPVNGIDIDGRKVKFGDHGIRSLWASAMVTDPEIFYWMSRVEYEPNFTVEIRRPIDHEERMDLIEPGGAEGFMTEDGWLIIMDPGICGERFPKLPLEAVLAHELGHAIGWRYFFFGPPQRHEFGLALETLVSVPYDGSIRWGTVVGRGRR